MSKRVSIYCSSSDILDPIYREAALQFAEAASFNNFTVVCGGSIRGLMGDIITRMLEIGSTAPNRGRVEGVIPKFMGELEIHHPKISHLTITESMSQRKELLRKGCDAVVAFPGGLGTLEEFVETFTLKRLGKFDGETIIFNQNGFYDPLLALFNHFVKEKMMNANYTESLVVVDSVELLIEAILNGRKRVMSFDHYLPGK